MQEGTKLCPKCYKVVPKDAVLCPYCGYRFPQKVEESPSLKCPNCGREVPSDAVLCPYCGYRIVKYQPQPAYVRYKERRPKKKHDYFTNPTYQNFRRIAIPIIAVLGVIFYVAASLSTTFEVKDIPQNIPENLREQISGMIVAGIMLTLLQIFLIIVTLVFAFLNYSNYKYSGLLSLTSLSVVIVAILDSLLATDLMAALDKAQVQYTYMVGFGSYIVTILFYGFFIVTGLEALTYYIGEASKQTNVG